MTHEEFWYKCTFYPYKKNKKGNGGQRQQSSQGVSYQPVPAPQYMV